MRCPLWLLLLTGSFGALLPLPAQTNAHVHLLVPGFIVQELPLKLPNLSCLRFTRNGRLFALTREGQVLLLKDTDADGLEDKATPFWDQPTLQAPVAMAWSNDGLYVSSHGKVSLLTDTDKNNQANTEEIIASGWPPIDSGGGGIDATGLTVDRRGNVYFALRAADESNPYRLKDNTPRYDLSSPRGTIQKWNKETGKLEIIATGVRFAYGLAFNRDGDWFCTDGESATSFASGSPLDELNQLLPGRHYGFPPADDQYLPHLISEPPVLTFGPGHESVRALLFNEKSAGRNSWGPPAWDGDALVAGQARGKIWRVRLVKTPSGYAGRSTLLARLDLLTSDLALSPTGDLYVACQSGPPDWGSGPKGEGKIFRISYADPKAPQPIAVWPANAQEVRVAFDRPVDPAITNGWSNMTLEVGDAVRAADRFESLKPPYKTVAQEQSAPRATLRVTAAALTPDLRTLVLATDPHALTTTYALALPGVRARGQSGPGAAVDLDYTLCGAEAVWKAERADPASGTSLSWAGWFPHVDSEITRSLLSESASYQSLQMLITQRGTLRLRSHLKLPTGAVTLRAQRAAPFQLSFGTRSSAAIADAAGVYHAELKLTSDGQPSALLVEWETPSNRKAALHVSYSTEADPTARPVPLDWLKLPWATPLLSPSTNVAPSSLAGGNFLRGKKLFNSAALRCASCHKIHGIGGEVGPDLSLLIHRDPASVLRDIREPSASIHPDYVASRVRLNTGADLTGFVLSRDEASLRFRTVDGKESNMKLAEINELRADPLSAMPAGLIDGLSEADVIDLVAFLVTDPRDASRALPTLAQASGPSTSSSVAPANAAPPLRSRREVGATLSKSAQGPRTQNLVPLNITLVSSRPERGSNDHAYPAWQTNWVRLLSQADAVWVSAALDWPSVEQFKQADALLFYSSNLEWSSNHLQQIDRFLERGGGLVFLHASCLAAQNPEAVAARLGLAAGTARVQFRSGPLTLNVDSSSGHPVTFGFGSLQLVDEVFGPLTGDSAKIEILATSELEGQKRPMLWTYEKGPGRVFVSVLGHQAWTFDDPLFRALILRGLSWSAGAASTRFENLATRGVTLRDP